MKYGNVNSNCPGVTSPWGQIRPVTATGLFAVVEIILVSYLASPTKPKRHCNCCTTGFWLTVGKSG